MAEAESQSGLRPLQFARYPGITDRPAFIRHRRQ